MNTQKKNKYTEKDIQILSDRQHVRKRINVYAGSSVVTTYQIPIFVNNAFMVLDLNFTPAVYKCVGEILDNCIDEFAQIKGSKTLIIKADTKKGQYTISDNGRGVPVGKHETGKYTPEVVFSSLRSGRNFSENKQSGVIGMNGMGSSICCFCSTKFVVDINRDGKQYHQEFLKGAEEISKPSIKKRSTNAKNRGTKITFTLDPKIFETVSLPEEMMHNRALEIAFTNPAVTVKYNDHTYRCANGLSDIVKGIVNEDTSLIEMDDDATRSATKFEITNGSSSLEFHVIIGVNEELDEKVFTWVNSSLLFDGGICNTQFMNAFIDRTIKHLHPSAKKAKVEITKNDVRQGILVLATIKLSDPEYDAQSKTRLTGPNLRLQIQKMVEEGWTGFARKNKQWLEVVLERAMVRYHARANKVAIKDHQKGMRKKVPGLIDATSTNRFECQILITEGESAASQITNARNPKTTASLPLTGKVNNVYGTTPAQLLGMGKITDLLSAIGLTPGRKAIRSELRFGRVVIATDADHDGSDIFTLLINLFYTHWPELFDPDYQPFIYRLLAPNVCLVKGKQRVHFTTRKAYQNRTSKYKGRGWSTEYFKGLGSMCGEDWERILRNGDTLIPIQDNGQIKETLELLFGPDTDARKKWLQQ